jgi:DNA-binding transcriptional MerR regulator
MNNKHKTSYEQWDKINENGPNTLYKIGEMKKICDVTRKALLVYEEAGIISPVIKNEKSGYRYYTLEDIRKINSLKTLQSLGLSLIEINEYLHDPSKTDIYIKRFEMLRDQLNDRISELKQRKRGTKKSPDFNIEFTVLPKQVFDTFEKIRELYQREPFNRNGTTAFDLAGRAHRTRQSTGKISDQNTISDSERLTYVYPYHRARSV